MNKVIYEDVKQIIDDNEIDKLKKKTFLITGASGMVGSYISYVLKLLNDEYDMNIKIVLCVRNVNKLADFIKNDKNIIIICQDVTKPFDYPDKIDYIVHAASPASPKIMKDYPFETNIANTIGTYNTLMRKKLVDIYLSLLEKYMVNLLENNLSLLKMVCLEK